MNVNFDIPMEAKLSYRPVVKYEYKVFPAITIGSRYCSNPPDTVLLHRPWGVAVDYESGNIYVTEQIKNRIRVFDSDGILLYQFGVGEMRSPISIAIFQGRIFITQYDSSCLLVYDTNGEFICRICLDNSEDSVIHQLRCIAINQFNEDIYVCNSVQNRILLLSDVYRFKDEFGSGVVDSPVDLQISENCIVVLSNTDPYLYTFDFDFNPTQNLIPNTIYTHLNSPYAFCIDKIGNFIFSDYSNSNVVIFDRNGTLVHKLCEFIDHPIRITVDSNGRILVITYTQRLLIF